MFMIINNLAGQNMVLDAMGIFAAVWLIWLLAGYYLVALTKENRPARYYHLLILILIIGLIYAISFIIGYLWFEARPFVGQSVNLLINTPQTDKSFPSDHAAIAFALAVACWHVKARGWPAVFIAAGLVAVARIYVGVHFGPDVIGGAVLGAGVAWLVYRLFDSYLRRLRQAL